MLPDNIIEIIKKYQYIDEIEEINRNIVEIISQLKCINDDLSEKLFALMSDTDIKESEQQLLKDSQVLRSYISSINRSTLFDLDNSNNVQTNIKEIKPYEKILVNVSQDNVCPKCGINLTSYMVHYFEGKIQSGIWWYKCPCCERLFCIESEIEDFDFKNTNIILKRLYNLNEKNNQIFFTDIIVLSTINACSYRDHQLKDVIANIPIFIETGAIEYRSVNISYCDKCKKYIMLKNDFKMFSGVIACRIIDETISRSDNERDNIEITQHESILYQFGYNVKSKDNLSDKQRHLILASVIESNILTREQICSHLDTLIERGSKIKKWKLATQKWKQDRQYVKTYNTKLLPEVLVNNVIKKYSIKK